VDLTTTANGIKRPENNSLDSITLNGKPLRRLQVQYENKSGSISEKGEFNQEMDEAVWLAFYKGKFEKVIECVNKGFDVNYRRGGGDGTTSLMAAAYHGNLDFVTLLLNHGAKCDLVDSSSKSALDYLDNLVDENLKSSIENCLVVAQAQQKANSPLVKPDDDVMYDIYCVKDNKVAFDDDSLCTRNVDDTGVWSPCDAHGWGNVEVVDSIFDDLNGDSLVFDDGDADDDSIFDNEDKDSNDENFYGNDYPDEDEEDFYNESYEEGSCEDSY